MRVLTRSVALFIAAAVLVPAARAIEIDYQFDPDRHNRFLSGFSTNPVQNPNVLGMPGLDFSGVGWGSDGERWKNVAMVTPQHFITADHAKPTVGSFLNFLGTDGVVRSYQVQSYIPLKYDADNPSNTSDLIVGQLSAPILASVPIKIYSVVRPGPFKYPLSKTPPKILDFYRGREMIVVGKNDVGGTDVDGDGYNDRGGKISKNVIDDVFVYQTVDASTNTVGVGFKSPPNTPDSGRFVGFDSGSPSFLLWDGQLTALGSHSVADFDVNPQYNGDGFLPYYIDQINALIAGSGYQLNVLSPERGRGRRK